MGTNTLVIVIFLCGPYLYLGIFKNLDDLSWSTIQTDFSSTLIPLKLSAIGEVVYLGFFLPFHILPQNVFVWIYCKFLNKFSDYNQVDNLLMMKYYSQNLEF